MRRRCSRDRKINYRIIGLDWVKKKKDEVPNQDYESRDRGKGMAEQMLQKYTWQNWW